MTRERSRLRPVADPAPDAPASPAEHILLGLQRSAGNAAVSGLLARRPAAQALSETEVAEELSSLRGLLLHDASVRTIQVVLGTDTTGAFTEADVHALTEIHSERQLRRGAFIGQRTLDVLVRRAVALHMEDEAIQLVVDYYKLTGFETLSIRFSPSLAVDWNVQHDPAGMIFVGVGRGALTDAASIRRAVLAAQATPPQDLGPDPVVLPVLKPREAEAAVRASRSALRDRRSLLTLQHAVAAPPTGEYDTTTVHAVAAFQQDHKLPAADGTLDQATFYALVGKLATTREEDGLIRLVIDYLGITEAGVGDVSFDPELRGRESKLTAVSTRASATLTFGPDLFVQPPERIVHRIARAYEEVHLRDAGVTSSVKREFLLDRFTMLSQGMADEAFTPFMTDAVAALAAWKALSPDEQAELAPQLAEVRDVVGERWKAATLQEQQTWQSTYDELMKLPQP